MIPLLGAFSVVDLRQACLQLNAIHTTLPKPLSKLYRPFKSGWQLAPRAAA
jgi:hypothetical protein